MLRRVCAHHMQAGTPSQNPRLPVEMVPHQLGPFIFLAGIVVCLSFVLLAWRAGEVNFSPMLHHVAWLQQNSKYQRAELTLSLESFKGHRARDTYTTLMSQR